ncbi:hypothetical protein ABRP59_19225 [Pectobacterium punjabense]|uniref:hypothetical protein n=1 Tax=Pectobacterium punjabense TaxID=2108399 RepID=UPI0032EE62C9
MAEPKNNSPNNKIFWARNYTNEEELIDQINRELLSLKSSFASGKSYREVSDLKNARKSVFDLIGSEIARKQYPRHSSTDSFRHLMLLVTPLNLLAPKWRKQYVLKDNPEHYSLGYYDFFEDKSHDGAIAAKKFEDFLQANGDFLLDSQNIVHTLEKKVVEILRMKPRVDYNFDDHAVTYLTGLEETFAYLDAAIDGCLKKIGETIHVPEEESTTYSLYKHVSKNAGLHAYINASAYYIRESEELTSIATNFLNWYESQVRHTTAPEAGQQERKIAQYFAAIHAFDKSPKEDWHRQFEINLRPEYQRRIIEVVRYLRYAKDNDNKNIKLRLIRRGSNNKKMLVYPALEALVEEVSQDNIEKLYTQVKSRLDQRKIQAELGKFISNIVSLLTCWENVESDVQVHMMSYCNSRKSLWTYRSNFIRKLLRLDYEQLIEFNIDITPILDKDLKTLDRALNKKLALQG